MTSSPNLDQMTPEQLRALAAQALQLQSQVDAMSKKIQNDQTVIEQLTYEIALLKRHKFAKRSEQISPAQSSLLDDLLDTDLEAIEAELKQLLPAAPQAEPRQFPKRAPLPPQFPRTVIRHEPENTQCACGCQLQRIGEDVSEAGLHAGRVYCRATCTWKMGLPSVRNTDPGAGASAGYRQRNPDRRPAGPRHGGQVCRSLAAVPAGENLWPRRAGNCALDLGSVGRTNRRAAPAAG